VRFGTKKVVIVVALLFGVMVYFGLGSMPKEEIQPLSLLTDYQPPAENYSFPEFITQGLPENFTPGTPTVQKAQYPDGTPVTVKVLGYTREPDITVVVQILDVSGETFISNTPEVENYTFVLEEIAGHTAVRYTKENTRGYVWYHRRYSIAIFTSVAGGFPDYLNELAELYMKEYPSTFG